MIAAMLIGAGLASGGLAMFPYTAYPLALRCARRRPLALRACRAPSATLIFCAHNEAASVPAKLANLRAIRRIWPAMRFRCFVDRSSDETLALLRAASDILTVDTVDQRIGKASGMRRLVAACDAEVIIFTDANVLLDPCCVPRLLAYFSDPAIGGVCGTLHYVNADASDATQISSAYWRLEEVIKARESRSGSTMGADGAIFATRRALYPDIPDDLLDDFIVSMTVLFKGQRLVSAPEVRAYETAIVDGHGEIYRRRRIACRAYRTHMHIWPLVRRMAPFDIFKYVSHKLIRWYGVWLVCACLALLALGGIAAMGVQIGLPVEAIVATVLALALAAPFVPLRRMREAALQLGATGLGMVDAWRGRDYRIWDTPSARAPVTMAATRRSAGGARPVIAGAAR